jgi:hypothetical protein
MTEKKPSHNEDEYFARQDAELLAAQRERLAEERATAERRQHFMKCPKDGYDLESEDYHGVTVDICRHCGGMWLDANELDQIAQASDRPGLLGRVFGDVMTTLRSRRDRGA